MTMKKILLGLLLLAAFSGYSQNAAITTQITNNVKAKPANQSILGTTLDMLNLAANGVVVAGGTDTYTATPSGPAVTSYTGLSVKVAFTNANTGPATLNLNGVGASPITKDGTTALVAGDIPAGSLWNLSYVGTNFQLSGLTNAAAGTLRGSTLASGVTASSLTSVNTLTGGATGSGFTVALGTSTITGQLPLTNGGTAANLSDPGADKILAWDDTDNTNGYWTLGAGLTYTHSTHTLSTVGTVTSVTSATGDATVATTTTTPVITIVSSPKLTTGRTIGITGDATWTSPSFDGSGNVTASATVTKINGTSLAGLATGILKNTTGTGVPSIAVASDFPSLLALTFNTQSGNYTLALTDYNSPTEVQMTSGSANTLTLPDNATVAFPIGTKIRVRQTGAGVTTFAAGGSATVTSSTGLLTTAGQNVLMGITKEGTNAWRIDNGSLYTSHSTGSIIFATSTGLDAQDNSNFFYDETNHVLSLGTNTPTASTRLEVVGISSGTNIARFATNANAAVAVVTDTEVDITGNLKLTTAGNKLQITEGTNGRVGQVALVSGTKAITISGLTTSSRAFITLVTPSGVTLTTTYQAVCTANTLTLQANVAAGTINTADASTLNYFVIN